MTSAKRPVAGFGLITRNTSKSNIVALAHCRASSLPELLFNQEVMFVTALGKLMGLFPHRRKKTGRYNIPHTIMHLDVVESSGKLGQGSVSSSFFLLYIPTWPMRYRQQGHIRHRASKTYDQSGWHNPAEASEEWDKCTESTLYQRLACFKILIKARRAPLPPSQWK